MVFRKQMIVNILTAGFRNKASGDQQVRLQTRISIKREHRHRYNKNKVTVNIVVRLKTNNKIH